MERISNSKSGLNMAPTALETSDGGEAWDAVPRDGPAVFVVDAAAFDHGVIRGRWLGVDVTASQEALQAQLTALLGREPNQGSWAIVDQVGLGVLMVPETLTVADLTVVGEVLAAECQP